MLSYFYQFPIDVEDASFAREEVEATTPPVTEIATQGRLEPSEGTIAVSALPGEEIVELKVHVGQDVAAGDELAILGSRKIRQAEQRLAIAQQRKAEAQLQSELQLSELRIAAARWRSNRRRCVGRNCHLLSLSSSLRSDVTWQLSR